MESKSKVAAPQEVLSRDGTRIAYRSQGSGAAAVFVHGSLATIHGWDKVATLLAANHQVITYDRRGRGGSGDTNPYDFDREVEDLKAVLAVAGPDAVLIGHSFGGAVAAVAAQTADISALVLYEPGIRLADPIGGDAVTAMEDALAAGKTHSAMEIGTRRVVGFSREETTAAQRTPEWAEQTALVSTWPRELRALDAIDVTPAVFADISVPTLLLRGSESPAWLRETTERTSGWIKGAQLIELPGQSHGATDTAPEMVANAVTTFLQHIDSDNTSMSVVTLRSDTSWNGTPYEAYSQERPQLTVMRYSIPPHSSLPWHKHPVPNTAFVISGSITLESIQGVRHVFHAGDAFAESVGNEHRGFTQGESAEIVCTYAGAAGVPLSIPTGR